MTSRFPGLTVLAAVALLGSAVAGTPRNPDLSITRPEADTRFPPFTRVLLEPVEIEFRPSEPLAGTGNTTGNRTEFPPTEADQQRLEADANRILREELAKNESVELTDKPGPGVLVLKPALRDIVWRLPSEEPPGSRIYLDNVADLTFAVDFADGESGRPLGRAEDRRSAEPIATGPGDFGAVRANRVSAGVEWRRVLRKWGRRLDTRVEQLYFEAKPR